MLSSGERESDLLEFSEGLNASLKNNEINEMSKEKDMDVINALEMLSKDDKETVGVKYFQEEELTVEMMKNRRKESFLCGWTLRK